MIVKINPSVCWVRQKQTNQKIVCCTSRMSREGQNKRGSRPALTRWNRHLAKVSVINLVQLWVPPVTSQKTSFQDWVFLQTLSSKMKQAKGEKDGFFLFWASLCQTMATEYILHYIDKVSFALCGNVAIFYFFICPFNEKLLDRLPLSNSLHVSYRLCLSAVQWLKIGGKTRRCALF